MNTSAVMIGRSPADTYDVIVLGAGMAGLAAAYKLAISGKRVLVLEKDTVVGGLAKTLTINGFQFDYCAHRFHSPDPELMKEVQTIMGENFSKHHQKSRIRMFGRYLKYPFELQNLLRAMPPFQALACCTDFASNLVLRRFKQNDRHNYRDWFRYYFGGQLYRVMCEPYTRKIWGMDPGLISADWADQRFQGPNLRKLIKKSIAKLLRLDFSSYSLEDESLAPDAGQFYYPKRGGIQAMPDRLTEVIRQSGSDVLTSVHITSIDAGTKTITFTHDKTERTVTATQAVISTIPLHAYIGLLKDPVPASVTDALAGLRYMDIVFVLLFLKKDRISNDTWLYFPDKKIAFNRAVEFKNWSETMAPPGQTSLCLDITVTPENENFWKLPSDELARVCIQNCEEMALCKQDEVFDWKVIRVPNAYPVYDLSYKDKVKAIVGFIESAKGTYCIGRTGIFRYQNSDGALDMGFQLAKRMLDPACEDPSVLSYSMKGVSY